MIENELTNSYIMDKDSNFRRFPSPGLGKSNDGKLTLTPWYALKEDGYNTYNCDIKQ